VKIFLSVFGNADHFQTMGGIENPINQQLWDIYAPRGEAEQLSFKLNFRLFLNPTFS
jgi:hypothetical protein